MGKPVLNAMFYFQIFIVLIFKAISKKRKESSLVEMKLKLQLKWNVDLLQGIKVCTPRPVCAGKQAELGKHVPAPK